MRHTANTLVLAFLASLLFGGLIQLPAVAQVRTNEDCIYFLNDKAPHVRNGCANVKLVVNWHITGGKGCIVKGWGGPIILASGADEPTTIPRQCLIEYWACEFDHWMSGSCKLPGPTPETEADDDANWRARVRHAKEDARDRKVRQKEIELEDKAAAAYRAQIDEEERAAKQEAEDDANREASQAILQGVGAVLQGLSQAKSQAAAPQAPIQLPLAGTTPAAQQSSNTGSGRSQTVTQPYKGSGSGLSNGRLSGNAGAGGSSNRPCIYDGDQPLRNPCKK